MKKIICLVITLLFLACDTENGSDCFKKEGDIVQRDIELTAFTRIVIFDNVQLFIKEGPIQKVTIESGDNLINDIEVNVEEDQLSVTDPNSCNFIRDYKSTKVYVTSPNITEIRNSSSYEVESLGVLNFPELTLYSENNENNDLYLNDGDFNLSVNVQNINIVSNGFSTFRLSGSAHKAYFGLFAGNTRILAENLMVNELYLYHRSSNQMIVSPLDVLKGEILSVGDVIAKNKPPIVEVEELFEGRLIFE